MHVNYIYNLQTDLQIQTWIQKEGTIWYFVGRAIRRFSKTRVKKTLAKRKISSPHSEPSDSEEESIADPKNALNEQEEKRES